MKKLCMAALLSVTVAASVSFGEVTPDISVGSKAVLFTFSGLNVLGASTFNGGIGAKYYLLDPIALRASLAFGSASQKISTTAATGGEDGKMSGMLFGLSAGAEYHLTFDRVSPFFGGLIDFKTTSTKQVNAVNSATDPKQTTTNGGTILGYTPGNSFTIGGLGGVEFFITKEISLAAEYQLGWHLPVGYKAKSKIEGTTTIESETDVPGTSFIGITNSGTLTLAVYF